MKPPTRFTVRHAIPVTVKWADRTEASEPAPSAPRLVPLSLLGGPAAQPAPKAAAPRRRNLKDRDHYIAGMQIEATDPATVPTHPPTLLTSQPGLIVQTKIHLPRNATDESRLLTGLGRASSGVLLQVETGVGIDFEILVFRRPALLPLISEWRNFHPKAKRAAPAAEYEFPSYYRQIGGSNKETFTNGSDGFTPYANRFRFSILFNFDTLGSVTAGTVLNPPLTLRPAYDPLFAGMPTDGDGNNALTNFDNVSIPLAWPKIWDEERFHGVRGLRMVRAANWNAFVAFLDGKMVGEIDYVADIQDPALEDEDELDEEEEGVGHASDQKRGECYDGEYEALTCVGAYIVFTVRHGDRVFYIVDSPFFGIGLRIFSNRTDALEWARGGLRRATLRKRKGFCLRAINHRGDWRGRLLRFFDPTKTGPSREQVSTWPQARARVNPPIALFRWPDDGKAHLYGVFA